MANLIQIKRSDTTATPTSLANGELAWSGNSNVLFVGDFADGVVAIGGARTPGTLTANQALVANSSSAIDKVIVANLVPTGVWANGAAGTAGQLLTSNSTGGVYWSTPSAGVAGSNTQVQFNDSGTLAGDGQFTFDKTADVLTVLNGTYQTGAINATSNNFFANTSRIQLGNNSVKVDITPTTVNAAALTVGTTVVANTTGVFTPVVASAVINATSNNIYANTSSIQLGNTSVKVDITPTSVNAAALTVGSSIIANTSRLVIGTSVGLQANGGIGTAGQVLHSNGTTAYWADTTADITSVVAGDGLTGGGTSGDVTLNVVGANGISVAADSVGVTTGSTLTVNASGIHVNSALSITDLSLSGNLTVSGTLTTVDTNNLVVKDSMIKLANGNSASDVLDIGFFGVYDPTGTQDRFAGIFRDATDGIFKVFANTTAEPSTTVDTAGTGFTLGTLQAYLVSGGLVSNSSAVSITANSTLAVSLTANSLTLSTPLAATSGGTGFNTYTSGDIIVANTGNALSKLSLGSDGLVLQSNGTALIYSSLDGGTF